MAYIPQREWEIEETELTLTSDNGHFLYMKTPLSEASNIATLIASETHIDPARDEGYMIYKIGYVQSVANGRSISMLWGNEKKPSFDWLTVEPTKVTIDRDLHIVGNITASEEVTAWVAGAVTSDVLANLTANAPLYKPTTSSVGLLYSSAQFEVNGASELQIKSGVLAPAAHTHLISQITGLQTELDGKASLDSNGKIYGTQLPALAITDTFTASSQSGMLALSNAEVGDICVRTDINKSFILRESPYSTLSNWQELLNPALPALSTVAISGSYLDLINRPTFGTAANNNTGDFILNQNSSAQNANIWISGAITTDGVLTLNNSLISNTTNSNFIKGDLSLGYATYQGYMFAVNGSAKFNGDVNSVYSYQINSTPLLLDWLKSGSAPTTTQVLVGGGTTSVPVGITGTEGQVLKIVSGVPQFNSISEDFIQNQNGYDQSANIRINGSISSSSYSRNYNGTGHTTPSQTPSDYYFGQIANDVNYPVSYGSISGVTSAPNGYGYSYQLFKGYGDSDMNYGNAANELWYRSSTDANTWRPWVKMWHSGNFNPSSKLDYRTFGTAANNNTGDFIAASPSSAQSASIWLSGGITTDGILTLNNSLISNTPNSNFIKADLSIGYSTYQGYIFAVNGSAKFNGDVNSVYSYQINSIPLLLDWLKSGSAPASGNIVVGNGATTNPSGVSVNQAIGGNALASQRLPVWDGNKFANSAALSDGLFVGVNSLARDGTYFKFIHSPDHTSSRNWRLANDVFAYGDFAIQRSTTQAGDTYENKIYFPNSGDINLPNLSGSGTRLVSATSDGTLGATSDIDVTSAKSQSFKLKNTSGDVVWSVELSGTDLIFKNSAGVSKGKLDQSGNFVAAGEVTAYGGI